MPQSSSEAAAAAVAAAAATILNSPISVDSPMPAGYKEDENDTVEEEEDDRKMPAQENLKQPPPPPLPNAETPPKQLPNTNESPQSQPTTNESTPKQSPNAATPPNQPTNNENSRPFNPDEVGPEIPGPTGDDLVLVNVPPELGGTRGQVERRKRLFAAKRFFASPDVLLPRRQKMVARKSMGQRRSSRDHENRSVGGMKWDDFFQGENGNINNNQSTVASSSRNNGSVKPKAKKKKSKAKSSYHNNDSEAGPVEVFRGTPDEPGILWPDGWIKICMERRSGQYKGHQDRYWITAGGKKLRSMTECKKFLVALEQCGGNENEAKKIYKSIVL